MHSEFIVTEDGSHTLFVPEIDECYHSTHGAVQESMHIFIEAGLKNCNKKVIKVLEIGFGTGLNAFLCVKDAPTTAEMIHYTTIEKYPVEIEKVLQLNYVDNCSPEEKLAFIQLHIAEWNNDVKISDKFYLRKIQGDFTQTEIDGLYDVIFFDAFSPEKQPEMWTEKMFEKIYHHAEQGAILTTYCAKGVVRRALISAGFKVERLPGPPGKREILRAIKL